MTESRIIWGVMRWGTWGANLNPTEVRTLIEGGIAQGVTHFDHADIYGDHTTEALFGQAVGSNSALRDSLFLTTKCGILFPNAQQPGVTHKHYNTSSAYIRHQVETSLRKLQTDRVDRLLIHRPDLLLHPEELAEIITTLKGEGKVLSFGLSNFKPSTLAMVSRHIAVEEHQVEIHPLHVSAFEDGTLDQCLEHTIEVTAWSPFAGGALFTPETPAGERVGAELLALAEELNADVSQVALAWLMKHPARIRPIVGTSSLERLKTYVKSAEVDMSSEQWYRVWSAGKGQDVE